MLFSCLYAQEAMVESGSQNARLPLGEDLVVGHVHARQPPDTAGSDVSPRIKRRPRAKTSLAEIERTRERKVTCSRATEVEIAESRPC